MMSPHARFFQAQLSHWPLAAENYAKLSEVMTRTLLVDDVTVVVQYNPGRKASTTANISQQAIQARPCFLCDANRPAEQESMALPDTPSFKLLVNPFPVLPRHYTLTGTHQPQVLRPFLTDFLRFTKQFDDSVVFYNGPRCGASAPDHLHFQAGNKGIMPLPTTAKQWQHTNSRLIHRESGVIINRLTGLLRSGWLIQGNDIERLNSWLNQLLDQLTTNPSEEPMVNLLGWFEDDQWQLLLFPRKAHRPTCYSATDDSQRLISPASVEMSGLMVVSRYEDYQNVTAEEVKTIFSEVAWSDEDVAALTPSLLSKATPLTEKEWSTNKQQEPTLDVGIVSGVSIGVHFPTAYRLTGKQQQAGMDATDTIAIVEGSHTLTHAPGCILYDNAPFESLRFDPLEEQSVVELDNVRIGIGFHWERTEKQVFEGSLIILTDDQNLTAVNRIPLEAYLTSVISSEMSANASASLLKAHAVISRSWLLAQLQQKGKKAPSQVGMVDNETTRIRWYDREDHDRFDVCADDHCQRYQGLTRATNPKVRQAIQATRGLVLRADGEICDARFSKCCGGYLEAFEHCWENAPKSYLVGKADWIKQAGVTAPLSLAEQTTEHPDLSQEGQARAWILGYPPAFCHTNDPSILSQVLNHYDQETPDFYRWTVQYTTEALSELIHRRSGIDFGTILELEPVERGCSGRLVKLRIVGSKQSRIIGKELEIRRTLSESHLYSSAFVVEKTVDGFILHGAGWGHGVGLCQIGAAVMGEQGYDFQTILAHYYPNTSLDAIYI
ncbi:MAG: DUF4922 domain-containing protein [Bacteroidales bacterium]|nr:DUF4922 domain-containing protein [Bacteroidales bacterium]